MSFFKKKNTTKDSEKKQNQVPSAAGIPPQGGAYAQGSYPAASAPPAHGYAPPPGAYAPVPQENPPPYTPYAQPPPGPPGQQPYYAYQANYPPQQPQNVVVQGAFDAGARFDGVSQPRIPPPPPGVAPNAAQVAAMQGHNVVGTQQRAGWFEGPSGGGYTIW